jgi:S-adenosylmethionine decarboxylase
MIFEGTEKKVEIVASCNGKSLRSFGKDFWEKIVACAHAQILSCYSNTMMDSYLLSESSLFVLDDRIVMITCGKTTLARAMIGFIDEVSDSNIEYLIYERKNENFPHLQPTSFEDDIRELSGRICGESVYFGEKNEHYLSLFHMSKNYIPPPNDTTIEILMYDIAPQLRQSFQQKKIADLDLSSVFPGYSIDDHIFSPFGYSLNAIRERCYYTIHVTPEEHGSYASFESNICFTGIDVNGLVENVVMKFSPERFDIILFDRIDTPGTAICLPGYSVFLTDGKNIGSSYNVQFLHYRKINRALVGLD